MGSNRYASPALLNWVEPYDVSGTEKTLFYTEVNTNFQPGDRVFIANGNYDSDLLIQKDKYNRGHDGYRVLMVDNCRLVLDIDYTGVLPNSGGGQSESVSDYIGLYHIDSYESYLSACRQVTTRGGLFDDKFNYYNNSIAFISTNQNPVVGDWGTVDSPVSGAPGFFVKNGTSNWTDISRDFFSRGAYPLAVSPLYYNNGKVMVMGKSFAYGGTEFKEGFVYKWDGKNWAVDITVESKWTKAIVSKSNFRGGTFRGNFNNGLYGTKARRIAWTGEGKWNGGTLLNSVWQSGSMNSTINLPVSYKASIDRYGLPQQKLNGINNNGYGFNYIIDSDMAQSDLDSGIIRNSKFGSTGSALPVVKNHILSAGTNFSGVITNGLFESCEFRNIHMVGGVIKNSRAESSKFTNVKSVNSSFAGSVISESTLISDSVIKILGYDEWDSSNRRTSTSGFSPVKDTNFKVYKFYIGEADFFRLRQGDFFYIKGIKVKDNSGRVLNGFDRKYRIGCWTEYFDEYSTEARGKFPKDTFYKRGIEHTAFLSTQEDNERVFNSAKYSQDDGYRTEIVGLNTKNQYSIDVFVSTRDTYGFPASGLDFNYAATASIYNGVAAVRSPLIGEKVDVASAYIIDANFESGVIENSDWNSGSLIGQNNDLTITSATNSDVYSLSLSNGQLVASTPYSPIYPESLSPIRAGEVLFMNCVEYDTRGKVLSLAIDNPGNGYGPNTSAGGKIAPKYAVQSEGNKGQGLRVNNTVDANGHVNSVQIVAAGLGYSVGDILILETDGGGDATVRVAAVDNGLVRLPDAYEVAGNSNGTITLSEIVTGTSSVLAGLTAGGRFITDKAENRWGYLSKTKVSRSKVRSGTFRRAYFQETLIQSEDYDSADRDYNNIEKIKTLVVSDTLFKDGGNILSSATYLNSHFVGGTDVVDNCIIQNSTLNGVSFARGTIRESAWVDGVFNGGTFYKSKSFDASPSDQSPYYYSNNTKAYFAKGITTATVSNTRYSWRGGQFNGGEFLKSDWEGGQFNGGVFYNSKWYAGTMNGGVLGDNGTPTGDTAFYNGTVDYATVENATVYAKDVNRYPLTASVVWNDGIFNRGVFGSDGINSSTWNYGAFNGGQFVDQAVWKDGVFNGGVFISGFGWTESGSYSVAGPSSSYSWQNGVFNGGEFGNGSTGTNSTWYSGEFNGGVFKGRLWNFGVFTYGEFEGSGVSAIGGTESKNASDFVDSYRSGEFYGLWVDGLVTDKKDIFIKDKKFSTIMGRSSNARITNTSARFKNALWKGGQFNHTDGELSNSVWLAGNFQEGNFRAGSFNPYVARATSARSFETDANCVWSNGRLYESEFYYSKWESGTFVSGTAYGMIFRNGTSQYMNANNIYWENGTWKNGNWNGSGFEYDGRIRSDFAKQVMQRVATYSNDAKYHIWNIFEDIKEKNPQPLSAAANNPISAVSNPTPTGATNSFPPVVF